MRVQMLAFPTQEDWNIAKMVARNTMSLEGTGNEPSLEWKKKILDTEHSPIRMLWFIFKLEGIPYYVSNHLVRHKIGVEHYVQSQRDDRMASEIPRAEKRQDEPVTHIIYLNAQAFKNICHLRLCSKADVNTRYVVKEMVRLAVEKCPEFKDVLVPQCYYRNGICPEMKPCGKWKRIAMADEDDGK